ncbi:MAG TPA: hypothetical protein VIE39_09820 [Thermoanaerobaculia bacterium]
MREPPALPHRWPFRFVDVVVQRSGETGERTGRRGTAVTQITSGGRACAGGEWGSTAILAEALAQAALATAGGGGEEPKETGVYLAGIQGFEASRPPLAGETLSIDVALTAAFGKVARFDGVIRAGEETLARGSILVSRSAGPEA